MPILPYERLTIETTLSIEEARRRLADAIEPKRTIRWPFSGSGKPFEGTIADDRLEMRRVIGYRNSFLPQITGQIRQGYQGAAIDLKFQMHPFVIVFIVMWLAVVGAAALFVFSTALGSGSFEIFSLIPLGMCVIVVLVSTLSFNFEVSKAKTLLNRLFAV